MELKMKGMLLERLTDDLKSDLIAAEYTSEEESGLAGGLVSAMFDSLGMSSGSVFGEMFFMPDPDEDAEVAYFICAMLISDDLENADMETLNKAVSRLNHTSPAGVFYVDYDGGRLLYKLGVPLPAEIKEEDLYEEMNIVVGNALSILDPSLDELMGIIEGV